MATPMTFHRTRQRAALRPMRRAQAGVVMAMTLIALVLLLVGVAAMLRSVDSTSTLVGNLAFRRDMTNRAEGAIATARTAIATGALNTEITRSSDLASANYSASRLASTTGAGVPDVLVKDSSLYAAANYTCIPACASAVGTDGIRLRWVIDRQCLAAGAFDTASCEFLASTGDSAGSSHLVLHKPKGESRATYRISVRISGPRGTEAYFQTSYAD